MTLPPSDPDNLREAFELFSQTSELLADTYAELQGQVARLSAELADANGELARRERLSVLGEVAAKLAHQLRTPLAAALLYVGHLARPGLQEEDRLRFAEKGLGRLRYLERLIQDMLAFVKGRQGHPTVFPIATLVDELLQVMEPQAALKSIRLTRALPDEPLSLKADRQAVLGTLINLLENAVLASGPGAEVSLEIGQGGAFVHFKVRDHGPGIPPELRDRLFEPFFTTRQEGSGLGLAIVKQTAEAHGGWIELHSSADLGSTFTLYLPRYQEA
ncbi:MAG: HAMP domain-containing histidine kinase [Hydrogenophilales bacterium]|nr:HAMP domain-containing histidine kinase [Hydrogenophilales bacterium]